MVQTRTTITKKALAIVLAVACLIAFTPAIAFTQSANAATKWKVSPTKATVYVGKYKTLKSNKTAKWKSSKKSVAKLNKSKGKTVKVKGVKAGKATIKVTYKGKTKKIAITVKKVVKVTGVTLSSATPKAGDTLTATLTPSNATNVKYSWTVDGTVAGTAKTFTVPTTAKAGSKIVLTVKGDSSSTATSEAVVQGTPDKVTITGMSGKTTTAGDTPNVGDTLKAAFPENTSDAKATYQWYRGTQALVSGTSETYTLTAADDGATMSVKVTLSNGTVLEAKCANAVTKLTSLDGYKAVIVKKATVTGIVPGTTKISTLTYDAPYTADTAEAVVYKDANADGILNTGEYFVAGAAPQPTVAWYNSDSATVSIGAAEDQALSAQIGKTVSATVTGDGTIYTGEVKAASTATVKTEISALQATDSDTTEFKAGQTTLTANLATVDQAAKATVSYQWSYKNSAAKFIDISGATAATYAPTGTEDNGNAPATYRVTVTGTGNYAGTQTQDITKTWAEAKSTTISLVVKGSDGTTITTGKKIGAGEALTASTTPVAAKDKVTYSWAATKAGQTTVTGTGATFTAPKEAGWLVTLSATTTDATYSSTITDWTATTLANVDKATVAQKAGTQYGTLEAPEVGDTLTVSAASGSTALTIATDYTVQWYADDTAITTANGFAADATGAEYKIEAKAIGKKITAKVTGEGTTYAGTATTAAGAAVTAKAAVAVSGGAATVGNTLTAAVTTESGATITDLSGVKYSWKVAGTEVSTTKEYTPVKADAGKAITLTVSGTGLSDISTTQTLTWNNADVAVAAESLTGVISATATGGAATAGDIVAGGTAYAVAAGGTGSYTYKWVDLQTGDVIGTGTSIEMLGKYTSGVKLTVTDNAGNSVTATYKMS